MAASGVDGIDELTLVVGLEWLHGVAVSRGNPGGGRLIVGQRG